MISTVSCATTVAVDANTTRPRAHRRPRRFAVADPARSSRRRPPSLSCPEPFHRLLSFQVFHSQALLVVTLAPTGCPKSPTAYGIVRHGTAAIHRRRRSRVALRSSPACRRGMSGRGRQTAEQTAAAAMNFDFMNWFPPICREMDGRASAVNRPGGQDAAEAHTIPHGRVIPSRPHAPCPSSQTITRQSAWPNLSG